MNDKYKIDVIATDKHKIPQRQCAKDGILPKFPSSWLISGRSGGGKTNLILNILTKETMYGNFYHYILVFSPTAGEYDDSYKVMNIPKENFIREFNGETLNKIIEKRKEQIKKDGIEKVSKTSRMLIIMDDVIADETFLKSKEALIMFCLLRHYLVSIIVLLQSYNKLPKTLRKNCNAVCVFPSEQAEIETLIDEITPAGMKKRDFEKVIDYCCSDKFSFLYLNYHADRDKQIRKNIDEIITKDKLNEIIGKDGNSNNNQSLNEINKIIENGHTKTPFEILNIIKRYIASKLSNNGGERGSIKGAKIKKTLKNNLDDNIYTQE